MAAKIQLGFSSVDAQEWIEQLLSDGLPAVEDALSTIIEADDEDLLAEHCNMAMAAAEVIAALIGSPSDDLPEEIEEFIDEFEDDVDEPLIRMSASALERMEEAKDLQDLFKKPAEYDRFCSYLSQLKGRLGED